MTKVVRINKEYNAVSIDNNETQQISFKECKAILNTGGEQYTDDEILYLKDTLYKLVKINYLHFIEIKQQQNWLKIESCNQQIETNIININTNKEDETQSHIIYKSEYRRAG
jgi:hypothetical protein